jgi:peptidase M50B-like protein
LRDASGSDASALALVTRIPAFLWGLAWVAISVVVLALTLRRLAGAPRPYNRSARVARPTDFGART